jgi:hypothetical protein
VIESLIKPDNTINASKLIDIERLTMAAESVRGASFATRSHDVV